MFFSDCKTIMHKSCIAAWKKDVSILHYYVSLVACFNALARGSKNVHNKDIVDKETSHSVTTVNQSHCTHTGNILYFMNMRCVTCNTQTKSC